MDKKKKTADITMIIALSILAFLVIILLIAKINLTVVFSKEVNELFSISKNISHKVFNNAQLTGLPDPVQRYFKYTLKEGQSYISYVAIIHDGKFKTGLEKGWINIKGEQYATTEKPGFIWKGTTSMFTARDMYIADKGRLVVSVLSMLNVVDAKGEQYNQGELLRWLGESILYPTNLLPDERLKWLPINATTAKLTFNYNGLSLFFIITFKETGEITQMETKRYMDKNKLETWIINCGKYKEINNVFVPTKFEVLWRLEKGDYPYARFTIKTIEYDNPKLIR